MQIYRATVLSTVLYGAESWSCTDKEYRRLNAFNTKLLRVLTRKQRDEISNVRLYKLTGMEPLEDTIRKYRLRWAGHVRRMDGTRLPKKIEKEQVGFFLSLFIFRLGGIKLQFWIKHEKIHQIYNFCDDLIVPRPVKLYIVRELRIIY